MKKTNLKKIIAFATATISTVFIIVSIIAKKKKNNSVYKNDYTEKNPFEGKKVVFVYDDNEPENADGVKGHLEAIGDSDYKEGFYSKHIKRWIDIVLSFGGLVVLSPILLGISIAIIIDDPGPVLFTQKRVGKNKQFFKLHKFRSMKMSTPHDVPTHQLENPEQYITKVGKFLRAHSLDELPQIWDIFIGNMSIVGPRPGLWNQDLLTAERDKYNANDVCPGLTGWAQINGRDELEIPDKAKLDGEYVKKIGLLMDIKCFLGSLHVLGKDDSVVEGGTGEIHKSLRSGVPEIDPTPIYGCDKTIKVDIKDKNVLITGADSYIGESFKSYAREHFPSIHIDTVGTIEGEWKNVDFSKYDCIYHVAGIAHADVGNVDDETKEKYYKVNTDLAIDVARKAKQDGVKQFVFMSSMIIYGESAPYGKQKIITRDTVPFPANFYGDSKWQADKGVRALDGNGFNVAVLRPPMIYGKGSKGNYPTLAKMAKKLPIFPDVDNQRSMLYIENLCEFLGKLILSGENGIYFPQNDEYTKTSDMVREIANVINHRIYISMVFNVAVKVCSLIPGKISGLVNKAFGNSCYDKELSKYSFEYKIRLFKESLELTERETISNSKNALMLASVASMIDQFNMPNICILQSLGYQVDVIADFTKPGTITIERANELKNKLKSMGVRVYDISIPRSLNPIAIINSYKKVRKQVLLGNYKIIHCHSPIGGVICRQAAKSERNKGTKVIYTAHGFHFFKGAPKKNWLIFYPIEKYYSRFTDVLITINKEDYIIAKKKLHSKITLYIPGIGVDTKKFCPRFIAREKIRNEIGINDSQIMILSVGELNENKNHISVIKALKDVDNIVYVIVGKGDLEEELRKTAKEYGVSVILTGFRTDVADFYNAADVYVLPSKREGLNVSLMEAMASGLSAACGNIRGNIDLIDDTACLFCPTNIYSIKKAILSAIQNKNLYGNNNIKKISAFSINNINIKMKKIYSMFDI